MGINVGYIEQMLIKDWRRSVSVFPTVRAGVALAFGANFPFNPVRRQIPRICRDFQRFLGSCLYFGAKIFRVVVAKGILCFLYFFYGICDEFLFWGSRFVIFFTCLTMCYVTIGM